MSWARILCAVDLSDSSRRTVEHAAELARRFGAELTLLHVGPEPLAPGRDILGLAVAVASQEAEDLETLQRYGAEVEPIAGRPVRAVLAHGDPAVEIVKMAAAAQVDVVVVGTHERKGVVRLLGSVAERVARNARCAVLIDRPAPDWGD